MTSRKTRQRKARRDRRLAKASDWARSGTENAKKMGHHEYHHHTLKIKTRGRLYKGPYKFKLPPRPLGVLDWVLGGPIKSKNEL